MLFMKPIVTIILSVLLFASCSKKGDVTPNKTDSTRTSTSTSTTSTTSQTAPGVVLTHDDSLHLVVLNVNQQVVKTSVSGVNLTLTYNENVDLYITKAGYSQTSAVHLLESFNHSLLAGFDFTTINEYGQSNLNWVDDNLNNVILKTVKDTNINRVPVVKITVKRPFTFFKIYTSNQDAIKEQNYLLTDISDIITFSSYSYFAQKNYEQSSVTAHVVFTK
jgi:hypothetical protein